MKTYKYRLSASVNAETLRRIYDALEDEDKPFEANVRKIEKNARKGGKTYLVTIENNDREHFAAVLNKCKD